MQKQSIPYRATIASPAADARPEQPYADNLAHLTDLELEVQLHLMLARQLAVERPPGLLQRANDPVNDLDEDRADDREAAAAHAQTDAAALRHRLAELKAKRRKRELLSRRQGIRLYFDETAALYELDAFERDVLMLLFIYDTSHTFKAAMEDSVFKEYCGRAGIEVGAILSILEPEFTRQIRRRSYFGIDARLIRNDLLLGQNGYYDPTDSIQDAYFRVHQRIVNFIVEDNNVYAQEMRCIEKVQSRVELDKLILPGNTKAEILERVSNYLKRAGRRSAPSIAAQLGYGTGMACLFYGPSGTGKTMLAHGIANHFGMHLLLVNLGAVQAYQRSQEEIIKYAFKEARLTHSIVFFDECDDLFKSDSYDSRILLIEIEKADSITILATNRTLKLDPALDRRIQLKVRLDLPGASERERIWRSLIPQGVRLGMDVDLGSLAKKFHFSGGLIKNALLAALDQAFQEIDPDQPVITHTMLERAAQIQSDQALRCDSFGWTYAPERTIDGLALGLIDKTRLKNLAACQQAGLLDESGRGTLILAEAVAPAVEALEAVACACGCWIQLFRLSDLFEAQAGNRSVLNPLTQELMQPLDHPFQVQNGTGTLTVLIDNTGKVAGQLEMREKYEASGKLLERIESSRKHVFLIVAGTPKGPLPKGLLRTLRIGHPSEMVQIEAWSECLGRDADVEDAIQRWVERHPLHPSQIRAVCREARLRSVLEHGSDAHLQDFVEAVILGQRKHVPVLFGRRSACAAIPSDR